MAKAYLVRHTQYSNPDDICPGRLPLPLSPEGLREAEVLRNYFQDKNISHIYSSAVERCKQTAEIIAAGEIEISYDMRLLESLTTGQGRPGNNGYNYFGYRHELGGEANADIWKRMQSFWVDVNEAISKDDKNIIISSHGDPLYFLYQYLTEQKIIKDIELDQPIPDYPNYQEKGSIRVVEFSENKWQVGELITQLDLAEINANKGNR